MKYFLQDNFDDVAIKNAMSVKEIIESLTLEDIHQFLLSLGVDDNDIDVQEDYLICPTICHNPIEEATSMKLYYYDQNKSFHCYTQCSENFNIIELYMRYMELNHYKIFYSDAEDYIRQFVGQLQEIIVNEPTFHYEKTVRSEDFIDLPPYNPNVLDCFIDYPHPLWLGDGISERSMKKFHIGFSLNQNRITIPHYDYRGFLVGVRSRALEEKDLEFGKYRPMMVGNKMYNHQLGFNLYGIYENKEAIKRFKRAVIFEGEKSVLLSDTFYENYSVAVATCGSQLNRFQINLLVKKYGVSDITLAFDKEFKNLNDPACRTYRKKLIDKCLKYRGLANFYYIFDEHNLLQQKDSPIDRGVEVYEKLIKKRIKIN